jgi:hypothetical protein
MNQKCVEGLVTVRVFAGSDARRVRMVQRRLFGSSYHQSAESGSQGDVVSWWRAVWVTGFGAAVAFRAGKFFYRAENRGALRRVQGAYGTTQRATSVVMVQPRPPTPAGHP